MNTDAPRSVLIADDNHDAADSLATYLKLCGHTARVVYTGPTAVTAALADPPDLAIIAIGLPGLDGLAVARELRGHPATVGVMLVAYTGYADADLGMDLRAAGFAVHFVKGRADAADVERMLAAFRGPIPDGQS